MMVKARLKASLEGQHRNWGTLNYYRLAALPGNRFDVPEILLPKFSLMHVSKSVQRFGRTTCIKNNKLKPGCANTNSRDTL